MHRRLEAMAVRQLVTGSDVCAPSDAPGSAANAASALADQLLGRTGKAQEKLREVRIPSASLGLMLEAFRCTVKYY